MAQPPTDEERRQRQRLRAGDPQAFAEVYRRHQPGVYAFLYRLSNGNAPLAEDVCQHVFMNFWTHRADYDLERPLPPLLLTMARNAWINASKREEYRRTLELKEDGVQDRDRTIETRELEKVVEAALGALEPDLKEVFLLSRYHDLRYAQIAEMLGVSVKTVEARLSRALQELQKRLKDFL
jgi:RNA polymerase sigma-70 factor (ECF subfamily)